MQRTCLFHYKHCIEARKKKKKIHECFEIEMAF